MNIRFNLGPLETMAAFPYLGCTVVFNNSDCGSFYENLSKAKRWWGVVAKLLTKTIVAV